MICILCLFPFFLSAQSLKFDAFPKKDARQSEKAAKKMVKKEAALKNKNKQQLEKPIIAPPFIPLIAKKSRVKQKQINILHADKFSFDAFINPDAQVFAGNVCFRHDGAFLYCDSAHYYQKTNSIFAFGNVHMEQGDTIFLYGARLYYDGNTKLAMVREKVRLENKKVTLFTDSLNYDRNTNIGYFFDGGLLVNEENSVTNELSSEYGQYNTETKIADFKNDVQLKHPKFIMTNQELSYNTKTSVATINCPTEIKADSGYVYTEKGWYDTKNDKSQLLNRSYVLNNHKRLTGDTINYDKKNGIGEAFGNVELIDSTQQITFKGDYGYSVEKTEYALISRKALMIEHSSKDTLYLHADSLITRKDSIYKAVTAYHGVRFYRSDLQGICDSLYYSTRDSVLSLYHKPVLWTEGQQLSGDFMELFTRNNTADRLHIQKAAMAISFEEDSLYNQLSGKDLIAYFDSGQVTHIEVKGNAETIFLPRDEKDKQIMGLNRLEGSSLTIFMEKKEMKKIIVWPQPKGKFYPLNLLPGDVRYLSNFGWYQDVRPIHPLDVLREAKVPDKTVEESSKGRQSGLASDMPVIDQKTVQKIEKKVKRTTSGRKKGSTRNN